MPGTQPLGVLPRSSLHAGFHPHLGPGDPHAGLRAVEPWALGPEADLDGGVKTSRHDGFGPFSAVLRAFRP
eukprot:13997517-Alexandrium_andersonii.AAC.1